MPLSNVDDLCLALVMSFFFNCCGISDSRVTFDDDLTHEIRPNKEVFTISNMSIAPHVCAMLNSGKIVIFCFIVYFLRCLGICSCFSDVFLKRTELQIRQGIEDNSKIIFLISQRKRVVTPH